MSSFNLRTSLKGLAVATCTLVAASSLLASAASAQPQNYQILTGLWNRASGIGDNTIPNLGKSLSNCPQAVQGVAMNTMIVPTPTFGLPNQVNVQRYGCPAAVPGAFSLTATTAMATSMGAGGAFTIPANIATRPYLAMQGVFPLTGNTAIFQIATGNVWRIPHPTRGGLLFDTMGTLMGTLPTAMIGYATMNAPGMTAAVGNYLVGPTMAQTVSGGPCSGDSLSATGGFGLGECTNLAPFRRFEQSAWMNQTGRVGPNFTWCWGGPTPAVTMTGPGGSPACTSLLQGAQPLMVKFRGGPRGFGGTLTQFTNNGIAGAGSLVLAIPPFGFFINNLGTPQVGRMQIQGRGYADFLGQYLAPITRGYTNIMTNPSYFNPLINMTHTRVTGLTGPIPAPTFLPPGAQLEYAFPLTTGSVLARRYVMAAGVAPSNYLITVTRMGSDAVTTDGIRNIQVVTGAISRLTTSVPTVNFSSMFLPEPGRAGQVLAGVAALIGLAAWRARRRR